MVHSRTYTMERHSSAARDSGVRPPTSATQAFGSLSVTGYARVSSRDTGQAPSPVVSVSVGTRITLLILSSSLVDSLSFRSYLKVFKSQSAPQTLLGRMMILFA